MKHAGFPQDHPSKPLQQHETYAKMLALLGAGHHRVNLSSGDNVLVQARRFGPLGTLKTVSAGPGRHAMSCHIDQLRQRGVRIITPETAIDDVMKHAGFRQIVTAAHLAWLPLMPPKLQMAAMRGKWRNRLRVAQAADIATALRPFDRDRDHWLLTVEAAQQRARRYRNWPPPLVFAFAQANPGAVWIAEAKQKGTTIAAMLFLLHHPRVTYQIGWTSAQGRRLAAHNLLLCTVASHFYARSFARIDLGLINTETLVGLARFKLGAGAQVTALGGTWLYLPVFGKRRLAAT